MASVPSAASPGGAPQTPTVPSLPPVTPPTTPIAQPPVDPPNPPVTPSPPPPPPPSPTPSPVLSPPPPPVSPKPNPPTPSPPLPPTDTSSPPPPDTSSPPPPDNFSPPPTDTSSPSPPSPPIRSPPAPVLSSPPSPIVSSSPPPPPEAPGSLSPVSLTPQSQSSAISTPLVVGIAAGGGVLLVAVVVFLIFCLRRKKVRSVPAPYTPPQYHGGFNQSMQQSNWQDSSQYPDLVVHTKPTTKTRQDSFPLPGSSTPPSTYSTTEVSGSRYSSSPGQEHALLRLSPKGSESPLESLLGTFAFEELVRATDGFSEANLLGQGGFGYVHRGVLPSGKEVAIKMLKSGSGQGEREFRAEVEIISRVHHRHLVSLVGYCIQEDRRLLVYEFVPNNTLEFHLHGKGRPTMDWPARLRIARGSAKGLAYLHEDCHPKIVHRDIKTANILLDYKFEAKVADFGLAKFFSDEHTQVTTRIMGTFGYLAPEYASSGKVTYKSDVYSFGIMLLELITGRRPVDRSQSPMDNIEAICLVDWARPLLTRAVEQDNFDEIVDPRLDRNYNPNEMACMVACAAACVRHSARHRPRMSVIVRVLEGAVSLEELNAGITPGQSSVYGSDDSGPQMPSRSKFMRTLFSTQENESSEFSEATSEYGQQAYESTTESARAHKV